MPEYSLERSTVPIKYLTLEGGGVKGAAYPEALDELDKDHLLDDLECVAGSSAGGITAFLIAMGKNPKQIKEIMATIDFKELNDNDQVFWTEAMGISSNTVDSSFIGSVEKAIRATTALNDDGKRAYGIYKGNTLMEIIESILAEELGSPDATFADLERARTVDPTKKGLILTGTNLTKKSLEYFGMNQDPDTSNMRIADAVRITMSFPGAFEAVRRNGDIYVDGGLANNFPFEPFDKEEFLPDGVSFTKDGTNPATLGIGLTSSLPHDDAPKEDDEELGIMGYISHAFKAMRSDKEKLKRHEGHYVKIPDMGVKTLQFDLGEKELSDLAQSARESIIAWKSSRAEDKVTQMLTPEKLMKLTTPQICVIRHVCEKNGNDEVVSFIDSQMGHQLKDSIIYTRAVDAYEYNLAIKSEYDRLSEHLKEEMSDADLSRKVGLLTREVNRKIEVLDLEFKSMEIMLNLLKAEGSVYTSLISSFESEVQSNLDAHNEILARVKEDSGTVNQTNLSEYVNETVIPLIDSKLPDSVAREDIIIGYTTILRNFFDGHSIPNAAQLGTYFKRLSSNHNEKVDKVATDLKEHKDDIHALKELKRKYDAAKTYGERFSTIVSMVHQYKKAKRNSQNLWTKLVDLTKPFKPVFFVLDSLSSFFSSNYRKYKDTSNKLESSLDKLKTVREQMHDHKITDVLMPTAPAVEAEQLRYASAPALPINPKEPDGIDTVEELAHDILSSARGTMKFKSTMTPSAPARIISSAPARSCSRPAKPDDLGRRNR